MLADHSDSSLDLSLFEPSTPYQDRMAALDNYKHDTPDSMSEDLCTPSTLTSSANYINLQLTAHNCPVPLKFVNADEEEACKIVNCFLRLLSDKQADTQERQDLTNTIKRLKYELETTKSTLTTQTQKLAEAHRQIDQEASKRIAIAKSLSAEEKKHKATQVELQKSKINLQTIKAQYAHEVKKHELDNAKIKERLQKIMDERFEQTGDIIKMSSPLDKAGALFGPPKPNHTAKEEEMHKVMLQKSIERENQVIRDNKLLRLTLYDLHSALKTMLEGQIRQYHQVMDLDGDTPDLVKFRIPMELGGAHLKQAVLDLIAKLKEEWDVQIVRRQVYTEEEVKEKDMTIERLTQDLDEVFATLEQVQDDFDAKTEAYLKFAQGSFFDTIAHNHQMDISSDDITPPEVEDETKALRKLQREIREERQKLTEAAIKLGEDRTQLMAERQAFEQQQQTHQTLVVLDELSNTESAQDDTSDTMGTLKTLENLDIQSSSKKRKMDANSNLSH
ncbi:Afadin and alpha-actinin-binding-domain-containing protein [Umbelopsis sp. PMI_123]|nr:Afadin and alpha-actinin-binding-domain-containing protein [Umbelopsis sp. PMI_123]